MWDIEVIRFIYYIYNYRLLYYLPMERMSWKMAADENGTHYDMLEEENKNLKDDLMQDMKEITELENQIKKLKEKVRFLEECLDNKEKLNEEYRKEIDNKKLSTIAEETIQDLQARIKELEETLEHRDSVLSIMYDLLRSDLSDYEQLSMIDVVIDVEVWNEPQNKLREELLDRFWKRDF